MTEPRRFQRQTANEIVDAAEAAFDDGDLETLVAAIAELRDHRNTKSAQAAGDELEELLAELEERTTSKWDLDLDGPRPTDEWLDAVAAVASEFRPMTKGRASVYLALLWGVEGDDQHGVYVGMTVISPEKRYRNHKRGHKASRHVRRHGIGLLTPLFAHLRGISEDEALDIEEKLADRLRAAGLLVRGGH